MPPEYKCYDCGGFRVFGVGNARKPLLAETVFKDKKFYFASCCGKLLLKENRDAELAAMSPYSRNRAKAVMKDE